MIIDFHTHLDWYQNKKTLFEDLENFSGKIVASSVDLESFIVNIEIAKKYNIDNKSAKNQKIIPTFGVHPERAEKSVNQLSKFDKALNQSELIGEIGLDFYWAKNVSKIAQEEIFRYILEHCNNLGKYCVIHTKGAEKEIAKILLEYPKAKPIIHWYSGEERIFREFLDRGYFQTFGVETIRNSYLQHLLKITPENLILAETDNPTAEPWLGGSDISINLIKKVYQDLASILKIPVEKLEAIIFDNASNILI